MFPDFKDLLELLNKNKVKYLVVGGYAVSLHAQPRVTKDLDILILPSAKNADAVFRALREFGAPLKTRALEDTSPKIPERTLTANDFKDRGTWYTMGVPPVAIDILTEIPGVSFGAAWKNRVTSVIDVSVGLTANFIARDDLIAAKLASGRLRDLADVEELRAAQASQITKLTGQRPPKSRKSKSPPESKKT